MKLTGRLIAGLALASMLFAAPVGAQDSGSMQVSNATVTVGAGTAILTLPDVKFTKTYDQTGGFPQPLVSRQKNSEDFGDEIGWNVNGSVSVPVDRTRQVTLRGFWSEIDDNDTSRCTDSGGIRCFWVALVDDPNDPNNTLPGTLTHRTSRDVNHWGVSLEGSRQLPPGVMGVTRAPNPRHLSVGADIRGIDQDLALRSATTTHTYNEELDTRYYGAYAAWGGDTSPLLFKGLWERWGLQSAFRLQGGIYYADTDYSGRISGVSSNVNGGLSLSTDDVAFIGGLTLETRKQIGRRATLSLRSVYEYYSWVPDMRYNDVDNDPVLVLTGPNNGTSIGDDDAFSARTSLRLTVKLGPDSVMEPLK